MQNQKGASRGLRKTVFTGTLGAAVVSSIAGYAAASPTDAQAYLPNRTVYYSTCGNPTVNHYGPYRDNGKISNYGRATGPCTGGGGSGFACIALELGQSQGPLTCAPYRSPGASVRSGPRQHFSPPSYRDLVRLSGVHDTVGHNLNGVSHYS